MHEHMQKHKFFRKCSPMLMDIDIYIRLYVQHKKKKKKEPKQPIQDEISFPAIIKFISRKGYYLSLDTRLIRHGLLTL